MTESTEPKSGYNNQMGEDRGRYNNCINLNMEVHSWNHYTLTIYLEIK